MSNLCASISNKVADIQIKPQQVISTWIEIIPLGFTNNLKSVHNVCKVLHKTVDENSASLLEDPKNTYVLNKAILLLQYWTFELLEAD